MAAETKLPRTVTTPSELTALILDIRTYSKWFSQYEIATKTNSHYSIGQPEISATAAEFIRGYAQTNPLTAARLGEIIDSLEQIQTHAPTVTITLAAAANHEVRQTIVQWCREHLDANILIHFRFNATILGGMVVRAGSHIYDWSFRRAIMENRGRLPEVMHRV